MGAVVASTPTALPDPDPVCRAQARPRVLGLVDEGLQQPGPIAIEAFEVFAHRTHRAAQHVGGQVAAGNVGANQHPAQPHHPVQVGASARILPSDPGVAGLEPARRGREPHAAQPAVGGADEITQLMADKGTGAARMLVCHQGVPDQALRVGLDATSASSRSAPTSPGTSCAGATGWGSTRGLRTAPVHRRGAGSETSPAASRSANALRQLARWHRPRPSRRSNASQTRSATCPRLLIPCDAAASSRLRSWGRLPRRRCPT